MEQTLGQRIKAHRKRLGLTQDTLAERLGLTAQAISKWENDLSCPDVTILPRLAAIFGISTDELLGMEPQTKVHEAEVVDEDAGDNGIFNFSVSTEEQDGKWVFHWDSGRKNAVAFALFVLLVGIAYLWSRSYGGNISLWTILWPSFLLVFGIAGLVPKFSVLNLGAALFGGYFLGHNLGLWQLDFAGELIFPICIVLFGISLLLDALRKPKRPKFSVTHKGDKKTSSCCYNSADRFECDLSFGEHTHQVILPVLSGGSANVSFGELTVDLSGCDSVEENCHISANCSFGELRLLVPRRYTVQAQSDTAFASVKFAGHPDSDCAGVIHLTADASFGEISVHYL